MSIQVEVHQNPYLPQDGTVVDAIVTVTMDADVPVARPGTGAPGRAVEIIMIDCSGSMAGGKILAAREAACVAIDTLRDGVAFAIVAGDHRAWTAYPEDNRTVRAKAATRAAAKAAVKGLKAGGGTSMGVWLDHALGLFRRADGDLNHAILLTDGQNGDGVQEFAQVLARCSGKFVCDSRGVGKGWRADDLIKIAEALLGTAGGIKDPAELADDFRSMIENAMGKTVANVALRVWTPAGARIRFIKQMFPEINDLTGRRTDVSARIGDYPTGAWGEESRDYHVSVELEPNPVGEELLAARVSLVHQDTVLGQGLVRALWTDDHDQATRINRRVAHYSGQAELADAIQQGLAARDAGDLDTATDRLGRAVRLAAESGREDTAKMLARVVEVDAATGTTRLRTSRDNADVNIDAEMAAVGSRKTNRIRPA